MQVFDGRSDAPQLVVRLKAPAEPWVSQILLMERVDPPVFFTVTTCCTVVFRFTSPKLTVAGERLTCGGVEFTVRVNFWVASGDAVLCALIVML